MKVGMQFSCSLKRKKKDKCLNCDRLFHGYFQVNGERQYLPVILLDGQISVKRSGIYAVLRTDFGLTVKYDWNMRLYVTVPSSYYNHLGGLCGNYNGDKADDLPEPKGNLLASVR